MTSANRAPLIALRLRGSLVLLALVGSAPLAAQSDGSLEATYARDCGQGQDTQICRTLRAAIGQPTEAATPRGPAKPVIRTKLPVTADELWTMKAQELFDRSGLSEIEIYKLADAGDPAAAYVAAGLERNAAKGIGYARAAAEAGLPRGYLMLGRRLLSGWERDPQAATLAFMQAGELGVVEGYLALLDAEANAQLQLPDEQIVDIARRLDSQNHPRGKLALALAYERGLSLPKDTTKSIALLREAAVAGNVKAAQELGRMTAQHPATGEDQAVALTTLAVSAASGDAASKRSLEILQNAIRADAKRNQDVAAYRAKLAADAERRAAAKSSGGGGGGFFAALMAATGAVMAGGSVEQVMGAAAQGAQMANPGGSTAAMLGQAASAVGAPSIDFKSALTGGMTGGGPVGGGSYPTKPNLALGSCPGFSEGNYRTVALSGGSDVQRKSMCGQAFEFYTMYKRAIAQGYSEADANRTYAAHEGAVANLRGFVGN